MPPVSVFPSIAQTRGGRKGAPAVFSHFIHNWAVARRAHLGYTYGMELSFYAPLCGSIAAGLTYVLGEPVLPSTVHIPAREAAASSAVAISRGLDAETLCVRLGSARAAAFDPVFGVAPVGAVRAQNGWLLFDLTDAFYTAAVRHVLSVLPPAADDCGKHALNRMLALARRGGTSCPAIPAVQRALLLALGAAGSPAARAQTERALLSMAHGLSPRERPMLLSRCGGVGDAAARILYAIEQRTGAK